MAKYQVIVGNLGTPVDTDEAAEALEGYVEYVRQSPYGYGRVSYEPVALFQDGEPLFEFEPPRLDAEGKPIVESACDVVKAWLSDCGITFPPDALERLEMRLRAYSRPTDDVADAWWVVDDIGAEGPYDEETALERKLPEQFVLPARTQAEAAYTFKRMVEDGE